MTPSGSFATWNGTSGSNGGTQYIAQGQGFLVKANSSSPALAVTEASKGNVRRASLKTNLSELQLIMSNNSGLEDQAVVNFNNEATAMFDNQIDGFKLNGTNMNVSTLTSDDANLAYNALPTMSGTQIIPVVTSANVSGDYKLTIKGLNTINTNATIYLEDTKTGSMTKVVEGTSVNFKYKGANDNNRYRLVVYNQLMDENNKSVSNIKLYPNPVQSSTLNIVTPNMEDATYNVYDVQGRKVMSGNVSGKLNHQVEFNVPAGVYTISISDNNTVITEKLIKE
jgi:hypothetical protein